MIWLTPHGELEADVHEEYVGLREQRRIALVDRVGRVWHYDAVDVFSVHDETHVWPEGTLERLASLGLTGWRN